MSRAPVWRIPSMENVMRTMKLAAGLAFAALTIDPALAQTTAPTQPAGAGQVMTQMPPDLMRASRLLGVDVYGADNQRIGDIDEILVDRQGRIHGLVVGVGGFLGIGQKDVAIPLDQVQWMSNQEVQASSGAGQTGSATNTAGGVTTPAPPMVTANQPAATGSTAAGDTGGMTGSTAPAGTATSAGTSDHNTPARAVVKMTKADLQNAPEFRYGPNDTSRAGAAGNTNPPPQNVNPPGNAPRQ
jgi:sporulation protein YlmC with PRC-barrel domain